MTHEKYQKAVDMNDSLMSLRTELEHIKNCDQSYLKHIYKPDRLYDVLTKKLKAFLTKEIQKEIKVLEKEFEKL